MKDFLIGLLVVALVLVTLGAVNHGVKVDLDYVFGTWHQVSLLWLAVIVLCVIVVTGVAAAGYAGVRAGSERHKLEQELERTYTRLRAAEAQARAGGGGEAAELPPAAAGTPAEAPGEEPPTDGETPSD